MSYLVSKTRVSLLTINGVDYTGNLADWTVSDDSALTDGLVSTSGELRLSGILGGALLQDYDRNNFQRGAEVILELVQPGGAQFRHPRGLLYVIGNGYSVEDEQTTIEIGCRIALAALKDDASTLLPYAPIPLDPTQETVQGVGGSLAAAGKYLFQDNQGDLQVGTFFDGDTMAGEGQPAGEWVSILGTTALSVQPLEGTGAIPDQIDLAYNQPSSFEDGPGRIDEQVTESYYFTTYPAVMYERTGDGLGSITDVNPGYVIPPNATSACGNTPPPPANSQLQPSCNEGYSLNQTPIILPAEKTDTSRTEYQGPAGQVSRTYQQTVGPAIEANNQYFADAFAFCRYTWSTQCQPNGACSTDPGMEQILLGYTEQLNYYGDANELIRTVSDNYVTTLSGAQPFDWRSGVINGAPQDFQDMSVTDMYRVSRVITEYFKDGDSNVQETTTYTSVTSRQVGIRAGSIDALDGIRTFQRRRSTTISTTPIAPDTISSPTTATISRSTSLPIIRRGFTTPPVESGPYIERAQVPVPFLFETQEEVDDAVAVYSDYIVRSTLGDAYGLQIGEALREDIVQNWRPGMPFRYWDNRPGTANDRLMAMRMDACVWGVEPDGAEVVTNGVWVGNTDGTVQEPSNLLGTNGAITPPAVDGETLVTSGSYAFYVDIKLPYQNTYTPWTENIVLLPPAQTSVGTQNSTTLTVWISGLVVGPGSLAEVGPNGSNPVTNGGDLILVGATVINPDLFTGYTSNSGES